MKTRSLVIIFLFVAAWVYADDRPTVDSLIGKQIYVEDAFAGQSFTLLKGLNGNKDYKVEWLLESHVHADHLSARCTRSGPELNQMISNLRFNALLMTKFTVGLNQLFSKRVRFDGLSQRFAVRKVFKLLALCSWLHTVGCLA